jgi:hypothetical protein
MALWWRTSPPRVRLNKGRTRRAMHQGLIGLIHLSKNTSGIVPADRILYKLENQSDKKCSRPPFCENRMALSLRQTLPPQYTLRDTHSIMVSDTSTTCHLKSFSDRVLKKVDSPLICKPPKHLLPKFYTINLRIGSD